MTLRTAWIVLLMAWVLGCDDPPAPGAPDVALDAAKDAGDEAAAALDAPADVARDTRDAGVPMDALARDTGVAMDAPRPDAAPADVRDVLRYIPERVVIDVPRLDSYAVTFVSPDVPWPNASAPPDDGLPRCRAGAFEDCACADGRPGRQVCNLMGRYDACQCPTVPAPATPLPARLVAPLSGMRVTSQRPTLRWVLPDGITRARVEVCRDRECARPIATQEVTGTSWRPSATLPPGIAFWRVRGLDAAGAVAWSSATWRMGVRHRDTPVDTTCGPIRDFNGDGYTDLDVKFGHAYTGPTGEHVHVYYGSLGGISGERSTEITTSDVEAGLSDGFGFRRAAGDFNGDGYTDIVAIEYLVRSTDGHIFASRLWLYAGSEHGLSRLPTLQIETPPLPYEAYYAWPCVGPGDFNGDGFDDLLIRLRPSPDASSGLPNETILLLGGMEGLARSRYTSYTEAVDFGEARMSEDEDGDGYADIAAAAIAERRYHVAVAYGNPEARLGLRVQVLPAELGDRAQLTAGDINGDQFSDLFGGNGASPSTNLYTFWGTSDGLIENNPQLPPLDDSHVYPPSNTMGFPISSVGRSGDTNGDGFSDVTFLTQCTPMGSDPFSMTRCTAGAWSRVYLYAGSTVGLPPQATQIIQAERSSAASEFRSAFIPGDFNGDGFDDMVISISASDGRTSLYVLAGGPRIRSETPTILVSPDGLPSQVNFEEGLVTPTNGD